MSTTSTNLRLRAMFLEDTAAALRERGDEVRAETTGPWQKTQFTTDSSPIALGMGYFNAAIAANRLAAELRALADMEEEQNGY